MYVNACGSLLLFMYLPLVKAGRTCEMAQWIRMLVAKSEDLCLIPKTHMVENRASSPKSSDLQMWPLHVKPWSLQKKCTWCCKSCSIYLVFFLQEVCFQRKLKFSYINPQNSSFRMPPFTSASVLRITECFQPLIPVLRHCPTVYLTFSGLRRIAHWYQLSTPCYLGHVLAFSLASTVSQVRCLWYLQEECQWWHSLHFGISPDT